MLFGNKGRKSPFSQSFDPQIYAPGGGIGGGLGQHAYAQQQATPEKKGGPWKGIAGTVGDFLLQQSGMQPVYAPAMQQRRKLETEEAQYQRQRADQYSDWQKKQQWELANPKPVNNDTVADYQFILQNLGPERAREFLENKANPPVYRQGADGAFYRVDTPQVPKAPVGKLTPITGGAATPAPPPFAGSGFIPPQRLKSGVMTSGRRTLEGNNAVGGVRDSKHLTGEAVDYDGPDLSAVLAEARRLPGVRRAFIHKGHVHTEGDGWAAPYYGKNGTRGLNR